MAKPDRPASADRASRAERLAQWAKDADPGATFVYHSGAFLTETEAVRLARSLHAAGVVLFLQRRVAPGHFDYLVQRRRGVEPIRSSRAAIAPVGRPRGGIDEDMEQLMAVLRRLANGARVCPTNAELAELALLKDAESVRYRLGLLAAADRIRVRVPPQGPRVITIVSSGRSTARC